MEEIDSLKVKASLAALEVYLENHHGYSWDLASEICTLLEDIINYYGYEYSDDIVEAVKNCKIEIFPKTKNDVSALKYSEGEFMSTPIIKGGLLIGCDRKIILPPNYNTDSQSYRGILIKQLLKLVRSSKDEYQIANDILVQRDGFNKTVYRIQKDDTLEKQSEIGISYENGTIDNSELEIMRANYDENFELPGGNDYERLLVGFMEGPLALKEINNRAAMSGDFQVCEQVFEEHLGMTFNEFLTTIDRLHELETRRKFSSDEYAQRDSLSELEHYFRTQVAPIMHNMLISIEEQNKKVNSNILG